MGKKLIGITIALIMLFAVFGLTACDNVSLDEYKATKSLALQNYADSKCADGNYCTDDLATIYKAVTDGKTAIAKATNNGGVDTAYKTAANAIDGVVTGEYMGQFYTLQMAYDDGLLTLEDLQNIADYHNDGSMTTYPNMLSEEEINKICKLYFSIYIEPYVDDIDLFTLDDVEIAVYYGTYTGVIVIKMKELFPYDTGGSPYTVGGIEFGYSGGNSIIAWK